MAVPLNLGFGMMDPRSVRERPVMRSGLPLPAVPAGMSSPAIASGVAPQIGPQVMAQPQRPGFGQRLSSGLSDMSGTLIGLGTGLLAHRNDASNPPFNAQALMLGQKMDTERKEKREEKEKDRKMRFNTAALMVSHGVVPTMDEALSMVDVSPELALKGLQEKLFPEQRKPTAMMQNAEFFSGLPEGDPRRDFMLKSGSGPTINVGGQEKGFDKKAGELLSEQVFGVFDAANSLTERAQSYGQIGELLSNPNVYTGTGAESIHRLKRMGSTMFGMDFEGVADAEVAKKIGAGLVGNLKEMLPGPMSDADRKFLESIPPGLGDSPEGIQLAVALSQQAAEAARERSEMLMQLIDMNDGTLNMPAWLEFQRRAMAKPIFDPRLMEAARRVAGERAVPRGPTAGFDPEVEALIEKYTGGR